MGPPLIERKSCYGCNRSDIASQKPSKVDSVKRVITKTFIVHDNKNTDVIRQSCSLLYTVSQKNRATFFSATTLSFLERVSHLLSQHKQESALYSVFILNGLMTS